MDRPAGHAARASSTRCCDDEIDVGPLDSYVHDLLRRHEPETAAKLRVVASTAMTPIPPLVAARGVADDAVARLRATLLSCHTAPALAATRDALLLTRFEAVDAADYRMLAAWARDADDAGIPSRSDARVILRRRSSPARLLDRRI